jgi:hypothetical protein
MLAVLAGASGLAVVAAPSAGATTQNVIPILDCSYKTSLGMYDMWFGYDNPNTTSVTVAIGTSNEFTSGGGVSQNVGQPTTFSAGTHSDVFKVTVPQNVEWILQGTTINAPGGTTCSSDPGAAPFKGALMVFPTLNCDFPTGGSVNSLFGYTNPYSSSESVPIGSDNNFTGTPSQSAGQPSTFPAGTNASAFVVTHTGGINWFITNQNVSTPAKTTCSKNPVPIVSDHVGSLVVLALFVVVVGAGAFVVVRRRRHDLGLLLPGGASTEGPPPTI